MNEINPLHIPIPTLTRLNSAYDFKIGDVDASDHVVTGVDGYKVTYSDGVTAQGPHDGWGEKHGWAVVTRLYRTRMVGGEEVTLHHPDERVIEEVRTGSGHKGLSYRTCKHDGSPIMSFWVDRGAGRYSAWRHVDGTYCANGSHGPDPVTVQTCPDCRAVDSYDTKQHAWSDVSTCRECGHEVSYSIGD